MGVGCLAQGHLTVTRVIAVWSWTRTPPTPQAKSLQTELAGANRVSYMLASLEVLPRFRSSAVCLRGFGLI